MSNMILENVDGSNFFVGTTYKKQDKNYFDVEKVDFKFNTSKMILKLDNLFNGDKRLSENHL